MASVDKLDTGRWQARWRDPDGKQRKRSFARKVDALRHLTGVESRMLDGTYVDASRSRVTVGAWAEQRSAGQLQLKPSTRARYEGLLRCQVLPRWGSGAAGEDRSRRRRGMGR